MLQQAEFQLKWGERLERNGDDSKERKQMLYGVINAVIVLCQLVFKQ